MITENKDAVGETYEDVYGLIVDEARKFNQKFPMNSIDDLLSHANEIYLRAYRTYKPENGKFPSWLRFLLNHIWLEHVRRAAMRNARLPRVDVDLSRRGTVEVHPLFYEHPLAPVIQQLSDDGKKVVRIVLEQNLPTKSETPGSIRMAIRQFLRNLGWTRDRIAESFQEIQEALSA